jgi:hypothetical protein
MSAKVAAHENRLIRSEWFLLNALPFFLPSAFSSTWERVPGCAAALNNRGVRRGGQ